jgi:carbon storage regulator
VLVLTRKIHETIIIGGTIRVTMVSVRGRQVRLAIEAPREVSIVREELDRRPAPALWTPGRPARQPAQARRRGTPSDERPPSLTARRGIARD